MILSLQSGSATGTTAKGSKTALHSVTELPSASRLFVQADICASSKIPAGLCPQTRSNISNRIKRPVKHK